MSTTDFHSLDKYDCKKLDGQPAEIYVRKGKCFIYIGEQRYDINDIADEDKQDEVLIAPGAVTSNVDFSKDRKFSGTIVYVENEEGWLLGVVEHPIKNKSLAVIRLEKHPTIN